MGSLFAIAIGGAVGAVLRFLISTGIYNGFGRDFPYGTLAVNVIGALLMGLLTAALVVEKVALASEYRALLLVGFLGSLTTFSTFSLETVYLLQQGHLAKAGINVSLSLLACLLMVWVGLLIGQSLFSHANGFFYWHEWSIPYGLMMVNLLVSVLIGTIMAFVFQKTTLLLEYQAAIFFIIVGFFLTFSSLYLCLYLLETGLKFETNSRHIIHILLMNFSLCGLSIGLSFKLLYSG
ncbi:MAG: fluoride efflux transporter CrcB [Methylococcales bacterium]|nr:fluoride efflux transporter CrcB [Methylococcales bacterium]